jgi:hypothetical protein
MPETVGHRQMSNRNSTKITSNLNEVQLLVSQTGYEGKESASTASNRQLSVMFQALKITFIARHFPPNDVRWNETNWDVIDRRNNMVTLLQKAVDKLSNQIYPANPTMLKLQLWNRMCDLKYLPNYNQCAAMLQTMCTIINKLPRGSTQGDALLSCICEHFQFKQVQKLFGDQGESLSKKRFVEARKKKKSLIVGVELVKQSRSVEQYKPNSVKKAVDYILSEDNIQILSWGTKKLMIGQQEYTIPKLCRKKIPTNILRGYREKYPDEDGIDEDGKIITGLHEDSIGDISFLKIVSTLTFNDTRSATAVDYATGILLYDNFDMVKRVIKTLVDQETKDAFLVEAEKVILFLKSKFPKHITKDGENISGHKLEYGLCGKNYPNESPQTCIDCQKPFKFFHKLMLDVHAQHHNLLKECQHKVLLYMGHTVRVVNQRIAVKKELGVLHNHPNRAYVVIDYKMKMLPVYFREKTLDHYGKKGMSWHGAMLYMHQHCEDEDEDEANNLEELLTTYYDHISDGDSKQDWQAVLAICEAILCRIEKDYPNIEEVVFQSDNARCYQNGLLAYGLMVISRNRTKLKVVKYIHTETQDGKCSIDAHFAVAMAHLMRYVNEGNNVITPSQLAYALSGNARLNNTVAELFSFDRQILEKLLIDDDVFDMCNREVRRNNEVVYNYADNTITVFDYSNMNSHTIHLNPSNVVEEEPPSEPFNELEDSPGFDAEESIEFDIEENDLFDGDQLINDDESFDELSDEEENDDTGDDACGDDDLGVQNITSVQLVDDFGMLRKSKRWKKGSKKVHSNFIMEDPEQKCPLCDRIFLSLNQKNNHYCKPSRSPKDMLSFAVMYADSRWETMNIISI